MNIDYEAIAKEAADNEGLLNPFSPAYIKAIIEAYEAQKARPGWVPLDLEKAQPERNRPMNAQDKAEVSTGYCQLDDNVTPIRRVVCAAIRAADGELLLGIRHYSADMRRQIEQRKDGHKFKHRHDEDQGFVDQFGVWMSREEAYLIAEENGQLWQPHLCGMGLDGRNKLYSEGLY